MANPFPFAYLEHRPAMRAPATPMGQAVHRGALPVEDERLIEQCLSDMADIMAEGLGKRFDEHGPGWTPLAARTVRRKSKLIAVMANRLSDAGPDAQLILSGKLQASFRDASAEGHVRSIDVGGKRVQVGSDLDYAGAHDEGEPPLPQRKILHLTPEERKRMRSRVLKLLADMVEQAIAEATQLPGQPSKAMQAFARVNEEKQGQG